MAMTRSPGQAGDFLAHTVDDPAMSYPRTQGTCRPAQRPSAQLPASTGLTPAARTAIRTSPGPATRISRLAQLQLLRAAEFADYHGLH